MPIYEYRCSDCQRVSSFFTRTINSAVEPICGHCHSRDMVRRMSSFALGKSVQSAHARYSAESGAPSLDYYNDPRNIGRNVEESFARHDTEIPDSVRDSIDAARQGEAPKGLDP